MYSSTLICAAVLGILGQLPPQSLDFAEWPPISVDVAALAADSDLTRVREAMGRLHWRGELAHAQLASAVFSTDHDLRQRAGNLLQQAADLTWPGTSRPMYPALLSDQLMLVSTEALRDDQLPRWHARDKEVYDDADVFNARQSVDFLIAHMNRAEPLLITALDSDDAQQRFLAACILGFAGRTAHAARICHVLVPHLRDNHICGDCRWACSALIHLGPSATTHLSRYAYKASDHQQLVHLRALVKYLSAIDQGKPPSWSSATGAIQPLIPRRQLTINWKYTMSARRDNSQPIIDSAPK